MCVNACMELILVNRCVRELTVRQNLHFFYQLYIESIPVYRILYEANKNINNFILALSHELSYSQK